MSNEIWIFGYGSLIFEPEYKGKSLANFCEPPIDGVIKKGIEFWHTSKTRGGAPTLCFDGTKRVTKGKCWRVVKEPKSAIAYLIKREGKIRRCKVSLENNRIVEAYCGDTYPDLKGKLPQEIAELAAKSEKKAQKDRGGITYIKNCKRVGVITPLMEEILNEIDKLTRGEK